MPEQVQILAVPFNTGGTPFTLTPLTLQNSRGEEVPLSILYYYSSPATKNLISLDDPDLQTAVEQMDEMVESLVLD